MELERTTRIDSEFYRPENIKLEQTLVRQNPKRLINLFSVTDGNHNSISDSFSQEGIPYYRGQDVSKFFIEQASPAYIDAGTFAMPKMKRAHIRKGDLLLSIVGSIGGVSLVSTDVAASCSCKLAILRPHSGVSSNYLAAFLASRYGQNQIKKFVRGAVQMGLVLDDIGLLYIIENSPDFQRKISDIIEQAKATITESEALYSQAEADLLSYLGLSTHPPHPELHEVVYNIKTLEESLGTSGRWDAELYQPKYDAITARFSKYDAEPLHQLATLTKGKQARSEATDRSKGTLYASIKDCSGNSITTTERTEEDGLVLLAPEGMALAITGATIGKVGLNLGQEAVAISGDLVGIHPKAAVSPYYLLAVLASWPITDQCRRDTTGATNGHLAVSDVAQYLIPLLPPAQQAAIAEQVQRSFTLRTESEALLTRAKQAVEVAIEQGEAAGLALLHTP